MKAPTGIPSQGHPGSLATHLYCCGANLRPSPRASILHCPHPEAGCFRGLPNPLDLEDLPCNTHSHTYTCTHTHTHSLTHAYQKKKIGRTSFPLVWMEMYEKSLGINLCSLGQKEWSGCIISLVLEESGVSLGEEQGDLCFALLLWR